MSLVFSARRSSLFVMVAVALFAVTLAAFSTTHTVFAQAGPAVTTVSGNGVVIVIWEPSTDSAITGYLLLRRRQDGSEWVVLNTVDKRHNGYVDRSVENGIQYIYNVLPYQRETMDSQSAAASPAANLQDVFILPPPEDLTLTSRVRGDGKTLEGIILDFKIVEYDYPHVHYAPERDGRESVNYVDSHGQSISYFRGDRVGPNRRRITDVFEPDQFGHRPSLEEGRTYEYTIGHFSLTTTGLPWDLSYDGSYGGSRPSQAATITTPILEPRDLTAEVGNGSVTLRWVPTTWDPPGNPVTGHTIRRSTRGQDGDQESSNSVYVDNTGSANTTFVDTDVEPGARYIYRVIEIRSNGITSRRSDSARVDIPALGVPPLPQNLGVSIHNGSVVLSWDASDDNSVTGYQVTRQLSDETLTWQVPATDTNFTDTSVTPASSYQYWVQAVNEAGASPDSNIVVAALPALPASPANLSFSVAPLTPSVALSWDAVDDESVTGYRIDRSEAGSSSPPTSVTTTQTTTVYTDTSVALGVSYNYSVSAVNPSGSSATPSAALLNMPDYPSAPQNLTYDTEQVSVVLSWDAPAQSRPCCTAWDDPAHFNIAGYRIMRRAPGDANWLLHVENTQSAITGYTDTDVVIGGSYEYQVMAFNGVGLGPASNTVTANVPVLPPAPTNLTATVADNGSVTLSWDAPVADEPVTGYQILRQVPTSDETNLTVYVENTGSADATYTDENPTRGGRHIYRVKAINDVGAGPKSDKVVVQVPAPEPPPAPTNLTATVADNGSVTLSWDAPTSADPVTGYQILRQVPTSDETELTVYVENTGSADATYTDENPIQGGRHIYRVKAINEAGVSPKSDKLVVQVPVAESQ